MFSDITNLRRGLEILARYDENAVVEGECGAVLVGVYEVSAADCQELYRLKWVNMDETWHYIL